MLCIHAYLFSFKANVSEFMKKSKISCIYLFPSIICFVPFLAPPVEDLAICDTLDTMESTMDGKHRAGIFYVITLLAFVKYENVPSKMK